MSELPAVGTGRIAHIAVAVITFKRPDGLAKLLECCAKQVRTADRPYRLSVLVVDNDAAGSARQIAESAGGMRAFDVLYVLEARQGIPIARNAALDGLPADADFACFCR